MTNSKLQVKAELWHEKRNDVDVEHITEKTIRMTNHPNDRITDMRISVGHKASALFVELMPRRWKRDSINKVINHIAIQLEWEKYADDINVVSWKIEAV